MFFVVELVFGILDIYVIIFFVIRDCKLIVISLLGYFINGVVFKFNMCNVFIREVFLWLRFIRNFIIKNENIERYFYLLEKVDYSFFLLLCFEYLFVC